MARNGFGEAGEKLGGGQRGQSRQKNKSVGYLGIIRAK